ncbi:ABC transporter permease [Marinicella meishanensis]|uniref:ABC transporter permease n=1 Tax=Marinicella meishanensis TaxID=2873263 RepID=UPI001CC09D00|nr:ABC transporter permease [Marinicella sp. NBU2979]
MTAINPSIQPPHASLWLKSWQHFKQDRIGMLGLLIVLLYFLLACGVWLGLWGQGWSEISAQFNQGPSASHWLGTNAIGQDVAERGIYATKVAFEVGLVVTVLATLLGVLLGAVAGFYQGSWIDALLLWVMGVLDSIPFYLFVAAVAYAMAEHVFAMHMAMIAVFWTTVARIIRSEVIALKQLEFVEAAQAMGQHHRAILWAHIIPNTSHLIIIQTTLIFVTAIKTEVILSFLGIGIKNGISWGLMIAESTNDIQAGYFNNFLTASLLLFVLVIGFNFFSDALQDALDPKINSHHAK